MVIETVIILGTGVAAGFWYFWKTRYTTQERLIIITAEKFPDMMKYFHHLPSLKKILQHFVDPPI